MSGNNQYTAQQFIEAIPGTGGIVSTIAKRVGCAWHTAKKYIDNYPTVARAYDDECERVTDVAESVLIDALTNPKDKKAALAVAKWWLTRKGKKRGFTQRQELDFTSPVVVRVIGGVDLDDL